SFPFETVTDELDRLKLMERILNFFQIITSVSEDKSKTSWIPESFSLHQNFPNPFNAFTQITFDIPNAGTFSLEIFNLNGERVRDLGTGFYNPGRYRVTWYSDNNRGFPVSSGIYFYRAVYRRNSEEQIDTGSMILMK
ncbi:MAG: T9SS type A sorting domain-containing protein, partial [Fidelibacterota bacterium]